MFHLARSSAVTALSCAVAVTLLAGCDEEPESGGQPAGPPAGATEDFSKTKEAQLTGVAKITVNGKSVNVSCSGNPEEGEPVIVLLAGFGDGLDRMGDLQKTLSEKNRVCSYDRLGEGASDQPDGPQDIAANGQILTAVIDMAAGDSPVVLAGHSMGGLIAARYAPDHQDKVKGLVLLDATTPTAITDTTNLIPESAPSPAADVRAQMIAINQGQNQEKITVSDGEVRSAGDIPVEVLQHGRQDLAAIPQYGPDLERIWTEGQREWLALSGRSTLITATNSGHYIYVDEPALAVQSIQRVAMQATAR